jgi:hypothetical protein
MTKLPYAQSDTFTGNFRLKTRGSFSTKTHHSSAVACLTGQSVVAMTQIARINGGRVPQVDTAFDLSAIP